MPAAPTVDAPDAPTSLGRYLFDFIPSNRKTGEKLYRAGHVTDLVRVDAHTLSATVGEEYVQEVTLTRQTSTWACACTCQIGPYNAYCSHAFAAARAWIAQLAGRPGFASPPASTAPAPSTAASPAPPKPPSFREQWTPILADKLGRALTPEEGSFLGTLASVFNNFKSSRWFSPHEIRRLGFNTDESRQSNYGAAYQGWWQEPPADPLALWQVIAHDIESSGLSIPEFMRPITDTAPVRAYVGDRKRREAVAQWNTRLDQIAALVETPHPPPDPFDHAVWDRFDLRLRLADNAWTIETRPHESAPWKPAPRNFIERYGRDHSGALTSLDAAPAVFAFFAVCQEHYKTHYALTLAPETSSSRALLRRLLTHPLARTLVVGADGQPLVFAPAPLAWRLAPSPADSDSYQLAIDLPDGSPLPPHTPHLQGRPDLYLHHGTVFRGPPPIDTDSPGSVTVPAEAIERPETLRMLRQAGAKLPDHIAARFIDVPMRPRIECAIVFDFAGNEILALTLAAVSEKPRVRKDWSSHGWRDTQKPPPAPTHASPSSVSTKTPPAAPPEKIHAFDLASATAAAGRLPALNLVYDSYQHRWTRRITRSFPDEFLAWRESLPPEVEVLATGELASLLAAPVRATVAVELNESSAHRDWFDLALALRAEDTTLTPDEIALLLKSRGKFVRLPGKGWRRLHVELEGASTAALTAAGFDPASLTEAALAGERHRFHALQLAQTGVAELLPERQAEALRSRARDIALPKPPKVPASLLAQLRPYQVDGFRFLAFLAANRLGGVLADDMGLGKTLQTLAWLLWLAERQPKKQPLLALVVCPKSVVGNWEKETARFAPSLTVVRFTPALADEKKTKAAGASAPPTIVVANYTQLRLNADHFNARRWHAIVLDEGQFIKNPTSKVAQTARDLPGEHRLVLTGTPVENRLLDLWSLFSFALPGLLGTQAAFKRHYADDNALAHARLRTRVRHFLLRRTKAQVATDLPARTEEEIVVELEGDQAKLYQAELKRARAQLLKVETAREFDQARLNILASLLRLRQICCHPALIDPAHAEVPSAKLDALLERIEELGTEGHQVLVFSQFVGMLELIRDRLVAAGIEHLMLTGQTEDRDALVARFQTEKRHTVFLLSLKAAGFGLNLTAASYVILYDPWWNPAVEAQAIDRTHRIGQTVPVNAYRLIARGTVEEKIRALQKEKSALAGAIVQEEAIAQVMDLESLRQILS